jgi:hypothetical protein
MFSSFLKILQSIQFCICIGQLGSRRDLCEEKSAIARNAYLLQLASANAHQNRYFHVDLQNVVKVPSLINNLLINGVLTIFV